MFHKTDTINFLILPTIEQVGFHISNSVIGKVSLFIFAISFKADPHCQQKYKSLWKIKHSSNSCAREVQRDSLDDK